MINITQDKEGAVSQDIEWNRQQCVTVIFNPVSGQEDPERRKEAISEALAAHGYTCQYVATTPKQGARHYAEEAIKHGVDLLAVSGGDGTVVEAMSALIGHDIPLAVFPAGTGNLLSVNLGIPRDIDEAAHNALFGKRRTVDLARITYNEQQHCFAIIAGVGFDAKMIGDADREVKNKIGFLAYLWSAIKNLGYRSVYATIQLDDSPKSLRRRATSVMVANMARLPGGISIISEATPDDGMLEAAVLKTENLIDWLQLLIGAIRGRTQDAPSLEYYKARHVRVQLSRPQPLQYDGEEAGHVKAFQVEIIPAAVHVMVPQSE